MSAEFEVELGGEHSDEVLHADLVASDEHVVHPRVNATDRSCAMSCSKSSASPAGAWNSDAGSRASAWNSRNSDVLTRRPELSRRSVRSGMPVARSNHAHLLGLPGARGSIRTFSARRVATVSIAPGLTR